MLDAAGNVVLKKDGAAHQDGRAARTSDHLTWNNFANFARAFGDEDARRCRSPLSS
jgi:hypothetical protein